MENAPVITLSGRTIPPALEEKYNMWRGGAYAPLYMKQPGMKGLDDYKIIKKTLELPGQLSIFHTGLDFESYKKIVSTYQVNQDIARDVMVSFKSVVRFWTNAYELMGSFRNSQGSVETKDDTVVGEAPVIHIEGYKLPASDQVQFDNWFNVLASRIYIPLLLKIPGVKATNFFRLMDYRSPNYAWAHFVEKDMPPFISITYFENAASLDGFNQSVELAAFRRSLEVEFSGNLKTVWNTEYQLFSSHRPQPAA
jgi:hypothetical protein